MNVLGIDIGGSAIKGAPVNTRTGKLQAERCRIETVEQASPAETARTVREIVRHFNWKGPIGVGFPGVVINGKIAFLGNLSQRWVGQDAAGLIARTTGCKRVAVINDADAAGLAEIRFGAGRGHHGTVLMLTAGTGIGSALFRDGVLVPNLEFGHVPLRGRSAEKFASAAVRKRLGLTWPQWAARFNIYLKLVEGLLWPELIILGGGVSKKPEKWQRHLRSRAPLVPAALNNDAGIIGAALAVGSKR